MAMMQEVQLTFAGVGITMKPNRWKGGSKAAFQRYYAEHGRENYYKNHERSLRLRKEYRDRLRDQILEGYGGKCVCCGESEKDFLALDHVDPATKSKVKGRKTGAGLYKQARDAGFPSSYRLLCHNCNCARGFYGSCPHTRR